MMSEARRDQSELPMPQVPSELAAVVRAGVKAAQLVPGAVATGGTVCSLYAGHRLSLDIDFVVTDFAKRFDEVRDALEAAAGWSLARVKPPFVILGSLDKVQIGYRQLRRSEPLEKLDVPTPEGPLPIPTLPEMLRVKAFLACDRFYVRDFYDFAEMSVLLPIADVVNTLTELDSKWSSLQRPGVALEVMKALAECQPVDDPATVFRQLRFLQPKVKTWEETQRICREISQALSVKLLEE